LGLWRLFRRLCGLELNQAAQRYDAIL